MKYQPRLNLCTGERTGSLLLTIKAPLELAGARVLIDGTEYLGLSTQGDETIDGISSGPHEIRIQKAGYKEIVISVNYEVCVTEAEIVVPRPEPLK